MTKLKPLGQSRTNLDRRKRRIRNTLQTACRFDSILRYAMLLCSLMWPKSVAASAAVILGTSGGKVLHACSAGVRIID